MRKSLTKELNELKNIQGSIIEIIIKDNNLNKLSVVISSPKV